MTLVILSASGQRPPNIIFIMADDLGYGDVGAYGQRLISTPRIDALAREGQSFTRFYAGSPVCAPSRSALMTGQHTGHTRIRGNANVALQETDITLPALLKTAGYTTGMIGKWGLGDQNTSGAPNKKGFDYFYGYANQTLAHNYYPEAVWENERPDSLGNKVEYVPTGVGKGIGGIGREKNVYIHDRFLGKTLSFLDANRSNQFFLYLPFTLPHANNEAKFFQQSGMEVPDLGIYKDKPWTYDQKAQAAMITYLDTQVGAILDKLDELGLRENTIVIFTSDNGPHREGGGDPDFFDSNGPLRGIKRDMYEGGIRVPFIIRWPGKLKAGSTTEQVVAFWDILPTFCEIAGVEAPDGIDGISFLPTLQGRKQKTHEYLYWEFYEQGGKKAVLFGNWKCVQLNVDNPAETSTELYDLAKDPGEKMNLASRYPDITRKALGIMNAAHRYSADFHFPWEKKE